MGEGGFACEYNNRAPACNAGLKPGSTIWVEPTALSLS